MNHDMQSPRSDPEGIEAKLVVSSYGLDGLFGATAVNKLRSIGIIGTVLQMNTLNMNAAQDTIVRLTTDIVPGMIVIGMEAAEIEEASGVVKSLFFKPVIDFS
ncbi:hypothetical protein Nepgr_026176 [Nepenthes gracilis]|uniref:Uncharacterized protein n=1 Tax=Nepenthes gracilis TaxID=150966 RepID=A0AAD3T6D2_NEPGR|nr:hypothetical protein Nepgr_026176 [Nepenthes gracilis]